jgi:hypothetical protein
VLRAVAQMSLLSFQPAFDSFHAMFRLLRLRETIDRVGSLGKDHVRILDFYLLFPFRIREMRLHPRHQRFKRLAEKYAGLKPYGEQPDARLLYGRMEPLFVAAIETLASKGFIKTEKIESDLVEYTTQLVPDPLASRLSALNEAQSDLMEFMSVLATDYEVSGRDGLKSRTGLMEYRYDAL